MQKSRLHDLHTVKTKLSFIKNFPNTLSLAGNTGCYGHHQSHRIFSESKYLGKCHILKPIQITKKEFVMNYKEISPVKDRLHPSTYFIIISTSHTTCQFAREIY